MKKYQHAKEKKPTERVGFYIALSICMMAVGLAVWSAYSTFSEPTDSSDNTYFSSLSTENAPVGQEMTGVTVEETLEEITEAPTEEETKEERSLIISETAPPEAQTSNSAGASDPLQAALNIKENMLYPVKSQQVLKPYSEDAVYSKTLRDYRAHTGCDFAADEGENVYVMCDGTVADISVSELYGVIIEVDCGDCSVYYCGLDPQFMVEKEQQLSAGDVIGTVGQIPCESEDGSHVHIEIRSGDQLIDPLSVIDSDN